VPEGERPRGDLPCAPDLERRALRDRAFYMRDAPTKPCTLLSLSHQLAPFAKPALVNGAVGYIVAPQGQVLIVAAVTVVGGKITELDFITDPDKLKNLVLS